MTSANLPLGINKSVLSIDLSTYSTTSAINTLLANYSLTSSLTQALNLGVADVDHSNLVFTCQKLELHAHNNQNLKSRLELDNTGNLVWNNIGQSTVDAIATVPYVTSQLSNYWQQLNTVLPLTAQGTGNAITIESLFKPSTVTCSAGSGLATNSSDTLGTLNLSMNGLYEFSQVYIKDSINTVHTLDVTQAGVLQLNGSDVAETIACWLSTNVPSQSNTISRITPPRRMVIFRRQVQILKRPMFQPYDPEVGQGQKMCPRLDEVL